MRPKSTLLHVTNRSPLPKPPPRPDVDPKIALVPLPRLFAWLADKEVGQVKSAVRAAPRRRLASSLALGIAASVGEHVAPPPPQTAVRRDIIRAVASQAAPPPGSAVSTTRNALPPLAERRAAAAADIAPPPPPPPPVPEEPRRAPPADSAPVLRAFPLGTMGPPSPQTVAEPELPPLVPSPPPAPIPAPEPEPILAPEPEPISEPEPEPEPDPAPEPEPAAIVAAEPEPEEVPPVQSDVVQRSSPTQGVARPPRFLPPPLLAPQPSPLPRMSRADDFLPLRGNPPRPSSGG